MRNECIHNKFEIAPIKDKLREQDSDGLGVCNKDPYVHG